MTEYEDKYTVCLQGTEFILRKSQVEFDAPNYFTACFLGDFHEATTRRTELDRDPALFHIVKAYLNGYSVLPLNEKSLPMHLSLKTATINLRADAEFYQLDGLIQACDEQLKPKKSQLLVLGAEYSWTEGIDDGKGPTELMPETATWQMYMMEDIVVQAPLNIKQNRQPDGVYEVDLMRAIARLATQSIKNYDPDRFRLWGWNVKENQIHDTYSEYEFTAIRTSCWELLGIVCSWPKRQSQRTAIYFLLLCCFFPPLPPLMEYNEKYTVSIQGVDFVLSKSQIEFDGPNYFTTCFLGDFRESSTRRVELSRDPDLFRIVLSYLSGYTVLPLNEKVIPATMTHEAALLNLRADAEFYQLDGLAQVCEAFINPKEGAPKNRYLILGSKWFVDDDEYRGKFEFPVSCFL
ncbi:unnamed protein product [Rhizoctonia solani]|uniref:BTB domain-containing protein n=1 Tax=Rhizoctonia solani TaxID=456999 RepID=A0A8H2WAC4_9AGAM|nr:unnamed protein product [Rhizoctonia solani]